ncbi:hypothetical protein E2C01_039091 [Portunus trituberculatus]|uniref:Uncharacterized protein n=1 Tax=Portunus trituberculatus TaxID=210409 RepID=A0A5B7FJS4_PORTR|nr:hypothetical protein [Portunus trituberculatus]
MCKGELKSHNYGLQKKKALQLECAECWAAASILPIFGSSFHSDIFFFIYHFLRPASPRSASPRLSFLHERHQHLIHEDLRRLQSFDLITQKKAQKETHFKQAKSKRDELGRLQHPPSGKNNNASATATPSLRRRHETHLIGNGGSGSSGGGSGNKAMARRRRQENMIRQQLHGGLSLWAPGSQRRAATQRRIF